MTAKQSARAPTTGAASRAASPSVASRATLRYLKSSAQKTRLVVNEIRGKRVDEARAYLRHCRKKVADDVLKLLMSAVANTENRDDKGAMLDTEELYVTRAQVDQGPSAKRIQPAPMGRAFRILKRQCHVTIELGTTPSARS